MAFSFAAKQDTSAVDVHDLMDALVRAYTGDSVEAMHSVAAKFQGVAANREFIRDALLAELKRIAAERRLAIFAPQSFIIHRAPPFSLRLNLWLPPVGSARKVEQEARVYSYDKAHDHNFSLLTAGVAGSGYRTRIFEYDPESIKGYLGEPVDIRHLEDTMLSVGKAMIYRPHRDIHVQLPPDDASMSLNLLVDEKEIVHAPQYFFDIEAATLVPMTESEVGRRVSFLDAVGHFADETCASLLFDVARQNRNPTIRAAALQAIRTGFPERQREIEKVAKADSHPLVAREGEPSRLSA